MLLGWSANLTPSLVRSVEHDFAVGDAALSLLYFLSSVLFAVASLAGGFAAERFGRRSVLAVGSSLALAGLLVSAFGAQWSLFLGGASFAGLGTGLIEPQVSALFLDLFPRTRNAALNVLNAFWSVGSLGAPAGIGLAVSAGLPWRVTIGITAAAFLLSLLPLALFSMPGGRLVKVEERAAGMDGEGTLVPFTFLALSIALYTGAEFGVASWLVRFLAALPLAAATLTLSGFWSGLTLSRFLSRWIAERWSYTAFAVACMLLASLTLAAAASLPAGVPAAALFALAGVFYGPVFPSIMAIGGTVYPHRLNALSGGLTFAAAAGVIVYPPLMGIMATRIGLRAGMLGAALLGIPMAGSVLLAARWGKRNG